MILYHGTDSKFNKFSKSKIGSNTNVTSVGFFFTDNYNTAKSYGDTVLKCEVDLGAYIECDFDGQSTYYFGEEKWYTPNDLAVRIDEINKNMENRMSIEIGDYGKSEIDDENSTDDELVYLYDNSNFTPEDYLDMLGEGGGFDHQCDDKIDSVICKNVKDNMELGGELSNNYIVFDESRIKILNKSVYESLNERLEQLINEDIFVTKSAYDVKNLLQNKSKEYRVIYDSWIKTYIIADSHKYIHEDMIKKAYVQGCYAECPKIDEYFRSPLTVTDYLAERFEDETFLRLLFVPKGEPAFLGSDDYDFAYTYSFGTILSREGYWETSELYKIFGEPLSTESSFDESINERLEKLDNCFITSSPYDIVNLFKNKPKEYRVLYDKNIDMYMIGEADSVTHYDMINRAMQDAYYYNMEDFIDELGGTVDNYTEIGQSGFWDGDTEEENIEPYLWYIVFSPNEEWTLGTDGYNKRYDYPFGHVFTRGCDLDEISLWEALGVPQETEKLYESEETILNDAFYKWFNGSKVIKNGKPLICYHGTNAEFDTFNSRYIGSGSGSAWFGYGFYFSTEKDGRLDDAANWYGDKIMEVYLSIKNPFIFTDDDEENLKNLAKVNGSISLKDVPISEVVKFLDEFELTFDESKIDVVDIGKQYDICLMYDDKTIAYQTRKADIPRYKTLIKGSMMYDKFGFSQIMLRDLYPSEITESLKKAGYDGIFMLPQIVAFYPNQIKSVNNRGTWSTTSNNIYESLNKELERYI